MTDGEARNCPHGNEFGGVSTNFDPYGTRRRLGLPVGPWVHICWDCWKEWGETLDRKMRAETDAAARADNRCGFLEAWIGHCPNEKPCAKHGEQKCWSCGKPAIANCSHAVSLVCGMPYCEDHPHEGLRHGF